MLPTEEPRFHRLVVDALALYAKEPTEKELIAWWIACKGYALADIDRALKSHSEDPDEGKRAPRPIDAVRRVKSGAREGQRCAACDLTGQCEYPGIFSDGTGGDGPWFCPWHRLDRAGEAASRFIQLSREVPYEVAREKRVKRMGAEAIKTPAVVNTAWDIAKRHGAKPWRMRDLVPTASSEIEEAAE